MNVCLSIENATVIYPGNPEPALTGIGLTLQKGCHAAISGANGSGKSTLLKLMAGILWTREGTVAWEEQGKPETSRITGQKITRLLSPAIQEFWQRRVHGGNGLALLQSASPTSLTQPASANAEKALALLEELNALHLAKMPLASMSQGQLRLILYCHACLARPRILLLDEFMDSLDAQARAKVLSHLEKIRHETTIVFATHRQELLPDWISQWLQLENGRLAKAAPSALPQKPTLPPSLQEGNPQVVCRIKNANVYIDREKILHNINWTIRQGEFWRLAGPNGSGKSTLLRLLAGDEFAAAGGEAVVFSITGKRVETLPQWRNTVALVSDFSQANYDYDIKAWELVCSGIDGSIGIYRDFTPQERKTALNWLECFAGREGMEMAARSIRSLSTGQLRKLFLARAFINRPCLLLFDEPCNGLDASARADFLDCLRQTASGKFGGWRPAMIMVSHYQEDIPAWFQKTALMEKGKLRIPPRPY